MYSSAEFVVLSGKTAATTTVYPIVEIRIVGAGSGGLVEVVPVALVLQTQGDVSAHLMTNIKLSDE